MISLTQEQLHLGWPTPCGHINCAYGVRVQSSRHRYRHDGEGHAIDAGAAAADHNEIKILSFEGSILCAKNAVLQQAIFIVISGGERVTSFTITHKNIFFINHDVDIFFENLAMDGWDLIFNWHHACVKKLKIFPLKSLLPAHKLSFADGVCGHCMLQMQK